MDRLRPNHWTKVGGMFMGNPTVDVEIETVERESELIRMKLEISFLVIEILKTLSSLIYYRDSPSKHGV